jgi:hypothetical protein
LKSILRSAALLSNHQPLAPQDKPQKTFSGFSAMTHTSVNVPPSKAEFSDVLQDFGTLLHAGLIAPWLHAGRLKMLLAGFMGGLSMAMLDLGTSYSAAADGLLATSLFLVLRLTLAGVVGFAGCYFLMSRQWGRAYLVALQAVGTAILLMESHLQILNAIGLTLIGSPFWAVYHFQFAVQRSRHNHGQETALAGLLFLVSSSLGSLLTGWCLQMGYVKWALGGGAGLAALVTLMTYTSIPAKAYGRLAVKAMRRRRISTRTSIHAGTMHTVLDFCVPAWLLTLGLSPLSTGLALALRPVLGLALSPIAGHLAQTSGVRSIQIGCGMIILGWVWMALAVPHEALLIPAFGLLAAGSKMISPAEVGRWYKMRTPEAVVAREAALTIGRIPMFAVALPVAFLAPAAYPVVGVGAALLFLSAGYARRRK